MILFNFERIKHVLLRSELPWQRNKVIIYFTWNRILNLLLRVILEIQHCELQLIIGVLTTAEFKNKVQERFCENCG